MRKKLAFLFCILGIASPFVGAMVVTEYDVSFIVPRQEYKDLLNRIQNYSDEYAKERADESSD